MTYSGSHFSATKFSENKIFIIHSSTTNLLYGTIVTINGNTIVTEIDTQLRDSFVSPPLLAITLSENKIVIFYTDSNSSYPLKGGICTINGTTINALTINNSISTYANTGKVFSAIALSENKIVIVHSYGNYSLLYRLLCTVNGFNITAGTETPLSTITYLNQMSATALSPNKIFIAYNNTNSYKINGIVDSYEGLIKATNSSQLITGIAKTSGIIGDTIDVYVPSALS